MATYYARANGNINATNVWSTSPSGATSDLFPSFTNSDTLVANSFTITVNVNTTVLEVRNDATGGATATGSFGINAGITLTANVYCGAPNTGGCVTSNATGSGVSTLIGNVVGGSGSQSFGAYNINNGTLVIQGNVTGGTGSNCHGARNQSGGNLIITGNVIASSTGVGVQFDSATGNLTITGGITAAAVTGVLFSSVGVLTINGNIIGGTGVNAAGITINGNGTGVIVGNVTGGTGGSGNVSGVHISASSANIQVTGTVTGGSTASNYGLTNASTSTVTIIGTAIGGIGISGAYNSGNGTLTVTRAKGNGFGNGSVGVTSQVGVLGVQTGLTRVYEIEYGDLGQSPTGGPVFLFPASSNVALFYRSGTSKKTLVDAASSSGLLPNASDVRSGITYNAGTYTGTMNVPGAASVASGVAVDNTTGTAILTTNNIADIWNYPVSGISVSNSIGERLKNCSTVATMGQQLAAALNNVQ